MSRYDRQQQWAKRNAYEAFSFRVYRDVKQQIRTLAKENGIPISKMILDALERVYHVDLSHKTDGAENEFANLERGDYNSKV